MVSPEIATAYRTLAEKLHHCHQELMAITPDSPWNPTPWQESKTFFQRRILPLSPSAIAPEDQRRFQSVQTELHRHFRLLDLDLMRLRAAKQPHNWAPRHQAIGNRLGQMVAFCGWWDKDKGD